MKLLLYFLPFLLLGTCTEYVAEPYDPRLPIYSTEGRNVMGAYVNGSPLVQIDDLGDNLSSQVIEDTVYFNFGFQLRFKFVDEAIANATNPFSVLEGNEYQFNEQYQVSLDGEPAIEGKIQFVDTPANYLSGTFYFTTENSEVTNGRFDYTYFEN